jgi:hypothetical protein
VQPLADPMTPAEGEREQREQFAEPLVIDQMRLLKIEAARLHGREQSLNVVVATRKKIDLVFQTQVFKLKREMQK